MPSCPRPSLSPSLINMSVSSLDRVWIYTDEVGSLYFDRQYKCLMPIKHREREKKTKKGGKGREEKRRERGTNVLVVAFCI